MTANGRDETGSKAAETFLGDLTRRTQDSFERNRRLLSFGQFIALVCDTPQHYARNAAQYIRDCFDHFGIDEIDAPWGTVRRWRLFDCPFDGGRDRLIGQEKAQEAVYTALTSFVQDGRIQRLVLLHGPNGSAKSSLIGCIMRALEHYSHTDEGALYRFNWVFPADKIARESIGFGGERASTDVSSRATYAFLDDLDIDAKIVCELKDNPLFLLGKEDRARLLGEALGEDSGFIVSEHLGGGDLSHKSKQIFEALLASYKGDLAGVYRHIQVERFFISRRYRVGAATVEPQLRVDASVRQITADRSLQSLPTSLQNQTLFELFGDLIDGNRGMVEYNDLLKRPPDFNRYLLSTSEKGTVALDQANVHLDAVLIGSANETYLSAFKTSPEYPSFNARLELVRMPYLRNFTVEQKIYDEQVSPTEIGEPIAPHTTMVAALWAVLTRLRKPDPEQYPEPMRKLLEHLSPLEKADLYAEGRVPDGLAPEVARELRALIPALLDEGADSELYEGRLGASPREMKGLMLRAAQNTGYPHLSPLVLFEEMRKLVRETSVYQFLQMKPDGDYHRHDHFIEVVAERYLDHIDRDVRMAMGLVDDDRYSAFFERYVDNVKHWQNKEQLLNPMTGRYEDPDEGLMGEVEAIIANDAESENFRHDFITSIAAWSIDHPGEPVRYESIFPQHFNALRKDYFEQRREQIQRIKQNMLMVLSDDGGSLDESERERVDKTLRGLCDDMGYTHDSAREAVVYLLKHRYEG